MGSDRRHEREVLVVLGRIDRGGRFVPRACRSTPTVHSWPVVEDKVLRIELLDGTGRVLHREWAELKPDIDCKPGAPQSFRVFAYIELRSDAEAVRLTRDDLILWQEDIPGAPELRVEATGAGRGGAVGLRCRFSPPGPGASMRVVYRWGERRFRVVHAGPPVAELKFGRGELPGGEECLFAVDYSNGLRSAQAASKPFRMPRLGPKLEILAPAPKTPLVADLPIVLEAGLLDEERLGAPRDEDVVWHVDGEEAARGLLTSLDGLPAGNHELAVTYAGSAEVRATRRLQVKRRSTPLAGEWPDWDPMLERFEAPPPSPARGGKR